MSPTIRPLALVLLLTAAGCATLQPAPPPELDAGLRLDLGLAALEDGRHEQAFEELAWVMAQCVDREAALHARYGLVALELDPRNPSGRPDVGVRLAADLIMEAGSPEWLRPLAETTYLLALGLGAPALTAPAPVVQQPPIEPNDTTDPADPTDPDDPAGVEPTAQTVPEPGHTLVGTAAERTGPVHGCGPPVSTEIRTAASLPVLPGASMARMLAEAESQRDRQATRAEQAEAELATVRRELDAVRAELDRIRRTLRP